MPWSTKTVPPLKKYCHLDRIDVREGDELRPGDQLGLSGMSGRVTGPHLHWSVILNVAMVDPELFVAVPSPRYGR